VYSAVAAALMLASLSFVWTKLQLSALERHLAARQKQLESTVESLNQAVARIGEEVAGIERQSIEGAGGPVGKGLNLSKRSHALRMFRHGESPDQIASALKVPRQEVELLIKVHRIVISGV
jgi:hypothetical protein